MGQVLLFANLLGLRLTRNETCIYFGHKRLLPMRVGEASACFSFLKKVKPSLF